MSKKTIQKSIMSYFSPSPNNKRLASPDEKAPVMTGSASQSMEDDIRVEKEIITPVKRQKTEDSADALNKGSFRTPSGIPNLTSSRKKGPQPKTTPQTTPVSNRKPRSKRRLKDDDDFIVDDEDVEDDNDSDDDYESGSEKDDSDADEDFVVTDDDLDEEPAVKNKRDKRPEGKRGTPNTRANKSGGGDRSASAAKLVAHPSPTVGFHKDSEEKGWPPTDPMYSFLLKDKIKDKNFGSPDDDDYDERSLYVPELFLKKQTEAQKQWWRIKSENFDTILFFKVGKFYELFHMDAIIGIEELGLLPMGGSMTHSGFPEKSYEKFSEILRQKGYKIARIEQTESNDARDKRRASSGGPNVVRREICQITTPGTAKSGSGDGAKYLLAICERFKDQTTGAKDEKIDFGVCFVDSSVGTFYLSQFSDDKSYSRLRTLMAQFPPAEILTEKRKISSDLEHLIKTHYGSVAHQPLKSEKEFLSCAKTLTLLKEGKYFEGEDGSIDFPKVLKKLFNSTEGMAQSVLPEYELAFRSFGAITWYLKRCLIDEDLLTLKMYNIYTPVDHGVSDTRSFPSNMILDSVTLVNLDILGTAKGDKTSLFKAINYCKTKFGHRLFRNWMCCPSTSIPVINNRLDAVEDLTQFIQEHPDWITFMNKIPDLERSLSRIHSWGLLRKNDHPDSRAQMFDDDAEGKRWVQALLDTIESFKSFLTFMTRANRFLDDFKSEMLRDILTVVSNGGKFPDIRKLIEGFQASYDFRDARSTGKIIPKSGADPDYDEAIQEINQIQSEFEQIRRKESKIFGIELKFIDSGKKRYLLEAPIHVYDSVNPNCTYYKFEGSMKKCKRFSTRDTEKLLLKLRGAEEKRDAVLSDMRRRMFESVSKNYNKWLMAVKRIAEFDCLLSLTFARRNALEPYSTCCRPQFKTRAHDDESPFIKMKEAKHPVLMKLNQNFIPNDLEVSDKLIVVTGPNMGGKSTLMRTAGLNAILAHMGSYVPAEEFIMSPVDRIFTRLGASDNIMEGESTFMLELNETSTILKHATRDSLILLDELGRGTSTFDGTAIACAVVNKLASDTRCRSLFSTHYHSLVEQFAGDPRILPYHMVSLFFY